MLDVGAGQSISLHEAIARRAGPAAFDGQSSYPATKDQLTSHHGRGTASKAMVSLFLDLNRAAVTVGVSSQRRNHFMQPVSGQAPQQIITSPQIQIKRDVSPA